MTKKLFRSACFTSILVLLAFLIAVVPMTVDFCTDAVKRELKTEAEYLLHGMSKTGEEYLRECAEKGNRVTYILSDGRVAYDSTMDAGAMENHLDREEIKTALRDGEGYSVRRSSTLSDINVYYAVRLSDGSVLRVSGKAVSVADLLVGLTPVAVAMLLAALVIAFLVAFITSKSITRELENVDTEHPDEQSVYAELRPIIHRMTEQNQLITRQMEELRLRRTEFDAITQNMDDGLILLDERAKILTSNKIASTLLGIGEGDIAGEQYTLNNQTLAHLNADSDMRRVISGSLLGEKGECYISTEEKTYRTVADPVIIDGSVAGVAILMLDETEKEKREELRREFTSNISHELKTPLTSISGFAELIRCGIAGDNVAHFADNIYKEAQRLIILVNDIIKLSRLDGATPELKFAPTALLDVAGDVVERLGNVAEKCGITLHLDGTAERVMADRGLLSEIIYNLCDNAVKYGKSGGNVWITVGKRSDGRVQLTVKDDGIGIPADQQDRVFERFYRVDKSHSKEIGGTGLGLSIVKHGMACHNGEITLQSSVGAGTTVTATFPKDLTQI